jgi:branched-chain amino acid aminotransferase
VRSNADSDFPPVLVCTPSLLDGTILPGVTRDSVLSLLRDYAKGILALEGLPEYNRVEVQERRITMREIKEAAANGDLLEVFGSGTAACICPVKAITIDDQSVVVPKHPRGVVADEMYRQITSRQWGVIPDDEWTTTCA